MILNVHSQRKCFYPHNTSGIAGRNWKVKVKVIDKLLRNFKYIILIHGDWWCIQWNQTDTCWMFIHAVCFMPQSIKLKIYYYFSFSRFHIPYSLQKPYREEEKTHTRPIQSLTVYFLTIKPPMTYQIPALCTTQYNVWCDVLCYQFLLRVHRSHPKMMVS